MQSTSFQNNLYLASNPHFGFLRHKLISLLSFLVIPLNLVHSSSSLYEYAIVRKINVYRPLLCLVLNLYLNLLKFSLRT